MLRQIGVSKHRHQLPYQKSYPFRGATMSYRELGKGSTVILVHGSMISASWGSFEQQIAKMHRLLIPDLPGFGASDTIPDAQHTTDLFADMLCTFSKVTQTHTAPVIALSLGTVVAAKAAAKGCLTGQLILVGAPGKLAGWKTALAGYIPTPLRRMLVATNWGKEKILIPLLNSNVGGKKGDDSKFLRELTTTDPHSLADINYRQEIEVDFPRALAQIKNQITYIYGELDAQKGTNQAIKHYLTIPNGQHNIFDSHPFETLQIIEKVLNPGLTRL